MAVCTGNRSRPRRGPRKSPVFLPAIVDGGWLAQMGLCSITTPSRICGYPSVLLSPPFVHRAARPLPRRVVELRRAVQLLRTLQPVGKLQWRCLPPLLTSPACALSALECLWPLRKLCGLARSARESCTRSPTPRARNRTPHRKDRARGLPRAQNSGNRKTTGNLGTQKASALLQKCTSWDHVQNCAPLCARPFAPPFVGCKNFRCLRCPLHRLPRPPR